VYWQVRDFRREELRVKTATAFAPAAITNFFSIHYDPAKNGDFRRAGATGGGYVLSKGVVTKASLHLGEQGETEIVVDGDPNYKATTTRKAIELLFEAHGHPKGRVMVEQSMEVPVGFGFGASAAAAISGVYAVAAAMGLKLPRRDLAYHAHVADIVQRTGLGTVSVTFEGTGAGAITKAGAPGVSRFFNVKVPKGTRLVTASLAPFTKSDALSKADTARKINRLGDEALGRFESHPTLDRLASEGETFSEKLGLMTPQVRELVRIARAAGASHASQNMIGHAIHALTSESRAAKVADALRASSHRPRIDVLEVGTKPARAYTSPRTASQRSGVPS
jgi:pantoate kinase